MPKTVVKTTSVEKPFGKKGAKRTVTRPRAPKYYPAEDVRPKRHTNKKARPTKIRSSITPGTVLILLAGRYRGHRVVYLKTLASGLLLISGPIRINGIPLRRVNQRYVIATTTRINVSGVQIPEHINDQYFKKEKADAKKKTADSFFVNDDEGKKKKNVIPDARKADQKAVDAGILDAIKAHKDKPLLKKYLTTRFSLSFGQHPHELKF